MFRREIFCFRIKQMRRVRKESQIDLAEALEMSQSQVSAMETGRQTTTLENLYKICEYYNISADYLIGLTDEPRPLDGNQKEGSI